MTIDAGHLAFRIRPFNPAEAFDACLALVRPAAEDKRIKLQLQLAAELPSTISGDTTRLQQILLNLLWNAMKFTPQDGGVTLRVGAGLDWLRCEVIDTGPGIPPEKQSLLFQDFARLDPNAADGTGLGLAISARLAERMGGRLSFHPGQGGIGSVFRLELPWPAGETLPRKDPDVAPGADAPVERIGCAREVDGCVGRATRRIGRATTRRQCARPFQRSQPRRRRGWCGCGPPACICSSWTMWPPIAR